MVLLRLSTSESQRADDQLVNIYETDNYADYCGYDTCHDQA